MLLIFLFPIAHLYGQHPQNSSHKTRAESFKKNAEKWYANSEFDSAIYYWKAAAIEFHSIKDFEHYVHCTNEIGSTQAEMGRFELADSTLTQILSDGVKYLGDTSRLVGKTLYYLASCQGYVGKYDQSVENLKKSLLIARSSGLKDRTEEAVVLNGLGRISFFLSRYDEALGYFRQSLDILLESDGDENQIAGAHINIGSINLMKGRYGQAIEYYEQALTFIPAETQNVHKAGVYNNLGYCLFELGEYDRSLLYHQKALEMRRNLLEPTHPALGSSLTNVGNIYYKQGEIDRALNYYNQALNIRKQSLQSDHPEIGQTLMNIGMMHHLLGNFAEAEAELGKALEVLISGGGEKHQFVGDTYLNLGITFRKQNKMAAADSVFSLAEKIFIERKSTGDIISIYLQRAKMHEEYPIKAARFAEKAMITLFAGWNTTERAMILGKVSPSDYHDLLKILKSLAGAQERAYKNLLEEEYLVEALANRKLSVLLLDQMRLNYRSDVSKMFNDELHNEVYEKGLLDAWKLYELNHDAHYAQDAFWFMENSKARVLHTSLVESRARILSGVDSLILETRRDLMSEIAYLDNVLIAADSVEQTNLRNQLFEVTRDLENLNDSIKDSYPGYHRLIKKTEVAHPYDMMKSLADDEAIVEYFAGSSDLIIAVIRSNKFSIRRFPVGSLESNIQSAYRGINKRDKAKYREAAIKLYSQLIDPIADQIMEVQKLKIIPHGGLWYVPFEALVTGGEDQKLSDAKYLVKDYVISYHYSSTFIKESANDNLPSKYSLLAFAPVFNKNDEGQENEGALRYSDFHMRKDHHDFLRPLPESLNEVQRIQELFSSKGLSSTVYKFDDSKEEIFKSESGKHHVLHLATHSFINEEQPKYSGIYFTKPGIGRNDLSEDGILFSGELYNLDLNADLVVLSSCESGIGKLSRGEGMLSLSRGFYYAGARQVVYSLWKVYDKSTSSLMQKFYNSLLNENTAEEALREAKLELIKNKTTSFPKNWAGFVLLGN